MQEDKKTVNFGQAIVIPGEAPETDDEDDGAETSITQSSDSASVMHATRRGSVPISNTKYESLLQRKLRESLQNYDRHVAEYCCKTADGLSKEMKKVSQNIGTAQTSVQDAACSIRSVADVLYKVEENFDVIFNCQFMPDLQTNVCFPTISKYRNTTNINNPR